VFLANAYHHRSDGYSSVVALVAILGSGWFLRCHWTLSEVRIIFTVDIFLCFFFCSCFLFFIWIGFLVSIVIFPASQYLRVHFMK
jgi:divalent metal cation (Fe/Co/Zn/Cd) transporter